MLSRPNISSSEWITRQYDHEVQGGSVIKPLVGVQNDIPSDAVVMRPVLDSSRGLVVSQALNPNYGKIDTYNMVQLTIDEVVRRLICVGGDPDHIGGVDNFCWPSIRHDKHTNPDGKYKAAQLVRACLALEDTCRDMGIPLLSGKDSMYIDGDIPAGFGERHRISGLPTLQFTGISVMEDILNCTTLDAKYPGDLVYIIGLTKDELGGSEYYALFEQTGLNIPGVQCTDFMETYKQMALAVKKNIFASVHGIYRGGLGIHCAFVAMGGMLGMDIDLNSVPTDGTLKTNSQILYSESAGRFIVTVREKDKPEFDNRFGNIPKMCIGRVTDDQMFTVRGIKGEIIISLSVSDLKNEWKNRFGELK